MFIGFFSIIYVGFYFIYKAIINMCKDCLQDVPFYLKMYLV